VESKNSADSEQPGGEVDLFGAPIGQIRDRWGRPSFAKTKENQEFVSLLRAAGWSQARIAPVIGCDEKTLRKHFSRELAIGADLIQAAALSMLMAKAKAGHAASAARIAELAQLGGFGGGKREAKPKPLGKKEAARRDANQPPSDENWAQLLN
jgi:hypothetical protein